MTGANSGIGLHAAAQLAAHGAAVLLACRDLDRGGRAARRILAKYPQADVEAGRLDLADADSIRAFAERWTARLDILINNAGVMAPPKRRLTKDGFELQFGTNHLGHFSLTGLLLPRLLEAPAPRVVTVSSMAHFSAQATVLEANAGPYSPQLAYANSKLANLAFAFELQRRSDAHASALVSTAAHPGVAATGLFSSRDGLGANTAVRLLGPPILRAVTQPASVGARATLYAATVAEPGSYTGPQRLGQSRGAIGPAKVSRLGRDKQLAAALWSLSEDLTGLRYDWTAAATP